MILVRSIQQTLRGRLVQIQPPLIGYVEPTQHSAGALCQELPRNDVGMVLHDRDDDLVARSERGSERVRAEVECLRGVLGEHDFL